jgi:predicted O-methyltransferase YrrM
MANELAPPTLATIASWYEGRTFSEDWTTQNFPIWLQVLSPLRTAPVNVLEIGSWEGRSTLFFLNYLVNCRIVCVDTFAGGEEHQRDPKYSALLPVLEHRFDKNVEKFQSRVEKIKATSHTALADLGITRRRFDLVYIDGSHRASDVYSDAVLSWALLNRGGCVIFDDYDWPLGEDERDRPKLGIDAFLSSFLNQYAPVARGYQMIIRKL